MPAIGFVTRQQDGSYKGSLKTLNINAPIAILPISSPSPRGPHYRIIANNSVELGAGWDKESEKGTSYVSLVLTDPSFGKLYANLGPASGQDDPDVYAVIWNPPQQAR